MKRIAFKLAVLSTIGLTSASVFGAFVTLPPAGSPVAAGFNYPGSPAGTSAYVLCNTSGQFGALPTTNPTSSADTCAVVPTSETTAPEAGFSLITAASRPVVVNNSYTGNVAKTVGNVQEYVWRNSAATECIYGAKMVMSLAPNSDYLPATGHQYIQFNDFARGGFSGRPVAVAYAVFSYTAEVIYRVGLSYTSVQYRHGVAQFAELPLTTPSPGTPIPSIVGVDATPFSIVPTAAQQAAPSDDNWVNFTTEASGSSHPHSSMMYVKTSCNSSAPTAVAGAIRLRQTFKDFSSYRFIEVPVTGFVPPGGLVTPAHTDPF